MDAKAMYLHKKLKHFFNLPYSHNSFRKLYMGRVTEFVNLHVNFVIKKKNSLILKKKIHIKNTIDIFKQAILFLLAKHASSNAFLYAYAGMYRC